MPIELLTSKLFIPPLRPNLVPRPRLVQLLNEGLYTNRTLTLISAPAGFGKTTLIVDWLNQINLPVAWLSLDEADNDLPRFLTYLAAAIQQVNEQIGAPLLNSMESLPFPVVEKELTGLLNQLASRQGPLLLVLDDYHLLTDQAILQGMQFLLQHQPPQLHLVLTTREDPDLPLARLRARNLLTEIRARDLRFTQEEANIFLRDAMGLKLSEQNVTALEDRTEGWAVGLQLAGLSMQKQADLQSFIADFSGSHRHILDYLITEVLHQQPEDIQTFLLQTAALDRFNGPLCDAVTQRNDSNKLLPYLESANLFIIPLDEERRWYRYHQLFSDLLRNQLVRSQPELIPELHRRASRWYGENGDIHSAVDHALQDIDLTHAARLIEHHALPKLYHGEIAMVLSWFDRLPDSMLGSDPMLCISKAWALALMQRGTRRDEIDLVLITARRALDHVNADDVLRNLVAGHTASIEAFLLRIPARMGEKTEMLIALSLAAQRLLPAEEKAIRSINGLNIGYGYLALADLTAAGLAFQQAQEDGISGGNFYAAIYGPINLILSALLRGRISEALQLCDVHIERFNRILAGQYFPAIGALYILKGNILLEQNRLEEAEKLLMEGLELIHWTGESVAHRKGYTALAHVRSIQGDRPGTLEAVKILEETLPNDTFYAQALRHSLLLRTQSHDPNVQKDARTWLSQSGIDFDKLKVVSRLSPGSSAHFESYLNAAYVLARLAGAMPGAYRLNGVHSYLARQADFAEKHEIVHWQVGIAIARILLYLAANRKSEALKILDKALRTAAPTGLFRIFVDECESLQSLLQELKQRSTDDALTEYANRLLNASNSELSKSPSKIQPEAVLSDRELEVLQDLAKGLSYEEIGQHLYLSLNTIQFHVKNIYRKLLVNKRVHAIQKAREMGLI